MADPPPYEEATKGTHLVPSSGEREAPPAYDQLFGISDLREAKRQSPNKATFVAKFCEIVTGTIACAVCMAVLAALPISMIVIGSIYLHDCPGRRNIPIWLIVFGCVSVVQSIIDIGKRCFRKKKNENDEEGSTRERYAGRSGSCLESVLSFFLFIWIIIGSSWVFGYYGRFQECQDQNILDQCCHAVPYLFSFITLVVIYSVSLLICCCCCLAIFCAAFIGGSASD